MKYYHGSRVKGLKKLSLEKSNDGYVWLAEQYEFALMYGANSLRFWDYNNKTQKLIIREIAPNCFEKLYKGRECYIYSAKDVGEFEQSNHLGRRSIRCKHDVELQLEEYIPDAYEKIMKLYRDGVIELKFWKDYSPEEQSNEIKNLVTKFTPIMQIEFDKFRDEYNLLVDLRPELKLENINKQKN